MSGRWLGIPGFKSETLDTRLCGGVIYCYTKLKFVCGCAMDFVGSRASGWVQTK